MSEELLTAADVDTAVMHILDAAKIVATFSENRVDDTLVAFLQSNEVARRLAIEWLLSLFGGDDADPSRLPLMEVPEELRRQAEKENISVAELIPLLVKYGPILVQLFKMFRKG